MLSDQRVTGGRSSGHDGKQEYKGAWIWGVQERGKESKGEK